MLNSPRRKEVSLVVYSRRGSDFFHTGTVSQRAVCNTSVKAAKSIEVLIKGESGLLNALFLSKLL